MKIFIVSKKPIIHYRKLTDFKNDAFIKNLKALLSKSFLEEIVSFVALRKSVNVILEKHPSNKRKYNRGNQTPYVSKKLSRGSYEKVSSSKK